MYGPLHRRATGDQMSRPVNGIVPFGDRALLVETADVASAHALAGVLEARMSGGNAPAGVIELVVGFATVLVVLDPQIGPAHARACFDWAAETAGDSRTWRSAPVRTPRSHVLPVVFDGADLDDVAAFVGRPVGQVVDSMLSARFQVAFIGFAPGFPYLTGLPPDLAILPRKATPRTSVRP